MCGRRWPTEPRPDRGDSGRDARQAVCWRRPARSAPPVPEPRGGRQADGQECRLRRPWRLPPIALPCGRLVLLRRRVASSDPPPSTPTRTPCRGSRSRARQRGAPAPEARGARSRHRPTWHQQQMQRSSSSFEQPTSRPRPGVSRAVGPAQLCRRYHTSFTDSSSGSACAGASDLIATVASVLERRSECERCQAGLPPDSAAARVCSFECTF